MHRAAGHLLVAVDCVRTHSKLTPGVLRHRLEDYPRCHPLAGGCLPVADLGFRVLLGALRMYWTWPRFLHPVVESPPVVCTSKNIGHRPNSGNCGKSEFPVVGSAHMLYLAAGQTTRCCMLVEEVEV